MCGIIPSSYLRIIGMGNVKVTIREGVGGTVARPQEVPRISVFRVGDYAVYQIEFSRL